MSRESKKADYEKEVFIRFLTLSKLDIDTKSINHGNPNKNEPDFICSLKMKRKWALNSEG